jgi:glycosyltransferase involved in cell wall biosynthesis
MPGVPSEARERGWSLGPGRPGLVSVVIPTYNRRDLLAQTLASVRAQTHPDIEIVVVDDGSTDGTREFLAGEGGVRCIRQEHAGAQRARNVGVQQSQGDYIQFLDSDDLLTAGKLAAQAEHLAGRPEADAVYGDAVGFVDPDPAAVRFRLSGAPRDKLTLHLRGHRLLAHISSILWRRSAVERVGPWDERLSRWQDWDYLLRALVLDPNLAYDGGTCSLFRIGRPQSITTSAYTDATCATLLYAFERALQLLAAHAKDSPRNLGALCARGIDTADDLLAHGCVETAEHLVENLRQAAGERRVSGPLTRWFLRRWTPASPGLHRAWRALALGEYGLQKVALRLGIG